MKMQAFKARVCSTVNRMFIRSVTISKSTDTEKAAAAQNLKSWKEVPGPPFLPIIGPILQILLKDKLKSYKGIKLYDAMYKHYGPIVKAKGSFGAPDTLLLFDPEAVEHVLRSENTMPIRCGFESLAYYRHKYNKTYDPKRLTGLISDHGEKWKEFRSKVNPIMLQPKTIKLYTDVLEKVSSDMVARLKTLRDENGMITKKLDVEMNLWALESIGVVALGTRLNCFDPNLPADSSARKLIQNIHELFLIPQKLDFGPSPWRLFSTPAFKKAMKLYQVQENLTKYFIDQAVQNMEDSKKNSADTSNSEKPVLEKLLEIDVHIAHVMASDMLMAGVDTTAHTVLATLYLLAINPEKQKKLREEVLTKQTRKPYLRACIKESMRMHPVVTGNARLSTKEYNLLGYKIPKGVFIAFSHQYMSNMAEHYPKPEVYIPERWLNNKDDPLYHGNTHPFVTSPFGFGVRMCIGRRIAELEIETFISKIIENFHIGWKGDEPIQISTTSLNYVTEPFNYVFQDLTPDTAVDIKLLMPGIKGKPAKLYSSQKCQESLGEMKDLILFLHAATGCDTTSALFNIGKVKPFKRLQKDKSVRQRVGVFNLPNATPDDIATAGEMFVLSLYPGKTSDDLGMRRFENYIKINSRLPTNKKFDLAQLPLTSPSSREHSLRVYLQVQEWLGNPLPPTDWGFEKDEEGHLRPVTNRSKPAPDRLLEMVSCNCTQGCETRNCSCRRHKIVCSNICGHCAGHGCSNTLKEDEDNDDDPGDLEPIPGTETDMEVSRPKNFFSR